LDCTFLLFKSKYSILTPLFGSMKAPRPTAARLSSVNLADFFARKDLADFLLEALLDFLANGFAHSVCYILS
jgi:hypothetical protein